MTGIDIWKTIAFLFCVFKRKKRTVLILSATVVFITTYSLILPAITLDQETAAKQGGIDAARTEQSETASGREQAGKKEDVSGAKAGASGEEKTRAEEEDSSGAEDPAAEIKQSGGEDGEDLNGQTDEKAGGSVKEGLPGEDQEKEDLTEQESTKQEDSAEEQDGAAKIAERLAFAGKGYQIAIAADADAALPEDTKIKAREITEKDSGYDSWRGKALTALQKKDGDKITGLEFAKFYDITLTADGKSVEPEAPVDVTITYDKALPVSDAQKLRIVHFGADKDGNIRAEVLDSSDVAPVIREEKMTETSFAAESFSVYAVVYTSAADKAESPAAGAQISEDVLTADGKTYKISVAFDESAGIPEGSELNARELGEGSKEYRKYLKQSAEKLGLTSGELTYARFFDIEITDSEGKKIEPKAPVQVEITYTDPVDIAKNEALNVVHFADSGTEVIQNAEVSKNGKEISYEQSSFSVTGTIVTNPSQGQNSQYMILVKEGDQYYIVNNDGTLTAVEYENGAVSVDDPMLWTYRDNHLYFNSMASSFSSRKVAADFYYRYLNPNSQTGLSEDNIGPGSSVHTERRYIQAIMEEGDVIVWRELWDSTVVQYSGNRLRSGNNYVGVVNDNGTLRIAGQKSQSDAAEILLARASKVDSHIGPAYHTVNHIDVSIEGKSSATVPLSRGTYYYKDGGQLKSFDVTESKKLMLSEDVKITTDDMKRATITAYTLNPDGSADMKDDVYYITGYSSNKETVHSADQVRIEGSFKVADMDPVQEDQRHSDSVKRQRLQHKIYYNVAATKPVTFKLIDPDYGQLYDADGNELTVTINITMAGSFNYWDEANECPGIRDMPGFVDLWRQGDIYDNVWNTGGALSGMDFKLGGDADTNPNIVGLAITKLIVDENGNRIKPAQSEVIKNNFDIHWNKDGDPDSVKGLDVGEFTTPADYTGYTDVHSKSIKVGRDGIGMVYDYDVKPGMLYISEDKDSINNIITDTDNEVWNYVGTRIETEYVPRGQSEYDGKMHFSDVYNRQSESMNSIPEVLGKYRDVQGKERRNGFVEYIVYNIYKPLRTDIHIQKLDGKTGSPLTGATFSIQKFTDAEHQNADGDPVSGPVDKNGKLTISNLAEGYYQLKETVVPDGYIKTSEDPYFEVVRDASTGELKVVFTNTDSVTYENGEFKVKNEPGAALPSTGGFGTAWLYILGGMLLIGAGTALIARRCANPV